MVGNGKWTETFGKLVFMELESGRARPKDGERRGEREGERKKHPGERKSWDYENMARKTARVNKVGLPSNGAMMCFPLCAQLVYETVSNTSPLVSQTLTQAGEFNFSLLGGPRNSHVENFKTL